MASKFYFEFSIKFDYDYDVKSLENLLDIKPTRVITFDTCKAPQKFSSFIFNTQEYAHEYVDQVFEQFLAKVEPKLTKLPEFLQQTKGELDFCIVVTDSTYHPTISLSRQAIRILNNLNATYQVDYEY